MRPKSENELYYKAMEIPSFHSVRSLRGVEVAQKKQQKMVDSLAEAYQQFQNAMRSTSSAMCDISPMDFSTTYDSADGATSS